MYKKLMKMSGEKCFTLTADDPADMEVDAGGITILYGSGNELFIPREMVEKAVRVLIQRGELSVKEIHEGISNRNGACTDRLMTVLRKLPGVTFQKRPRILYYHS